MKKLLFGLMMLLLSASIAMAQTPTPAPTPAPVTPTTGNTVATILSGLPFNLSGDPAYRIKAKTWGGGVGMDLATWQFLTFRAEASQSGTGGVFAGAGLFVNLPTLLNVSLGKQGATWVAQAINPSIGIVPGYDFQAQRYDTEIVLSIIQVTF